MTFFEDITGQIFGKLKAIKRVEKGKHNQVQWLFRCDCGNEKVFGKAQVRVKKYPVTHCGCSPYDSLK